MNKKIAITIIIVIIIIDIIFISATYLITNHKKENKPKEPEFGIKNENENIYKEHCQNNLCFKITEFNLVEDYGGYEITITNKGTTNIDNGIKNLLFSTPSGQIKSLITFDVKAKQKIKTEVTFDNKDLINATDYSIISLTKDELDYFNKINEDEKS